MIRTAVTYGAALIALYLVIYNGSNSGTVIKNGADGVSEVTKTLQGR